MQTESDNATTATTSITDSTSGDTAFAANATGDGTAFEGNSDTGIGVRGHSPDDSDPETNAGQAGVVGISGAEGNVATNFGLTGVYGYADPSPDPLNFVGSGVWGDSPDFGVVGTGSIGVYGAGGWGLYGFADNSGLALVADGRAAFARSGKTTVKSGNSKKAVSLSGVTSSSLVLAVLAQNRSGRYVRAVVPESGKFTIYLNQSVGSDTKVTWIVFTNPSNLSG